MSTKKIKIIFDGPILSGTVSTAWAKCGKPNCKCKTDPKELHGPYYRWTGKIDGKQTTKTISKEVASECQSRIKNYRELQKKLERLLKDAIRSAPWATKKEQ
jgi:hypothetical protein